MGGWRGTWLGTVLMGAWAMVSVVLVIVAILVGVPFLGPKRSFYFFGPMYVKQLFWVCNVSWTVEGWEALPEAIRSGQQPVIFMGNHGSQLDPPLLVAAMPLPAVYTAKKEIKYIPLLGWVAMASEAICIDRGNRQKAIASIDHAASEIRNGKNVFMFP